jgi:hypothetical protein
MVNRGCKHATTGPPKDGGCPWCEIENVNWQLVGERAKVEAARLKIDELEQRIWLLLSDREQMR